MATLPRDSSQLKAVVKGAGPAGLAAAIALAQSGFSVHVIEKRPFRPVGQGRKNVVALRPEALRQLESLGALKYVLESKTDRGNVGALTRMTDARSWSEIDGSELIWVLKRYPPAEPSRFKADGETVDYEIPASVTEQFPSCYICLGDLEDSLAQAARSLDVKITYDATISLKQSPNNDVVYAVDLIADSKSSLSLGTPDLIVCASGKNDLAVRSQLDFQLRKGVLLTESNLPETSSCSDPFALRLANDADSEIETQFMSVFGVSHPSLKPGFLEHAVRKYLPSSSHAGSAQPSQPERPPEPLVEIQMNHASTAHMIIQPPRSLPRSDLEPYVLSRLNNILRPSQPFPSISALRSSGLISWGDPLSPVTIETATAPKYVFGNNVVLVGDCAISCSPSSGIGAEIGVTVDSRSIKTLAEKWQDIENKDQSRTGKEEERQKALVEFNLQKAQSAVMWSQASRIFYSTQQEADKWSTAATAASAA